MPSRTIVHSVLLVVTLATGLAALASLLVDAARHPAPQLHDRDFHFQRDDGTTLEITPARPVTLPFPFADFDLWFEIAAPEDGEVDVLFRAVEPVLREHGLEPFHARFSVLRLSTRQRGPAFRSRESALFGGPPGGVLIAAGLPATVTMRARGRRVEVNVAGQVLPPFEAADAHGQLAFVTRGGKAEIRALELRDVARPLTLLPIGWCALGGLALGGWLAFGFARQASWGRIGFALAAVPGGAILAGHFVLGDLLPETEPGTLALVVAALSGAPFALLVARRFGIVRVLLGVLAWFAAMEGFVRLEAPHLRSLEDPRLWAWLGEDSGSAPVDVLERRMSARDAVHSIDALGERVVFLGGEGVFESDPDRAHWIAPIACARASRLLDGKKLDGAVLSTLASHTRQQIECFERWYADAFRPRAVVLVVPAWEGEPAIPERVRAAYSGETVGATGPLRLLELWSCSTAALLPPSGAAELETMIEGFAARCRARGTVLLLVADRGLREDLRAATAAAAQRSDLPVLVLAPIEDPEAAIAAIGDGLADLLR